jgi:hypothetical protein
MEAARVRSADSSEGGGWGTRTAPAEGEIEKGQA